MLVGYRHLARERHPLLERKPHANPRNTPPNDPHQQYNPHAKPQAPSYAAVLSLVVGILHGVGGPGGILGVLPTLVESGANPHEDIVP